jgi:hypothetical protein
LLRICKVRENWFKQDTQCAYKVKLRRVREWLLPWKSNKYYFLICVCVGACWYPAVCTRISACSLVNPACNAHAPYCDVICGLHHTFRNYLINGSISSTTFV